jgi:hypothetical protein
MKKLLLLAILLFGLDTYAQSAIYITNTTSYPCTVYVTARGSRRPACTQAIYTTFTLTPGQSVSLDAFTDLPGPWYQGGTSNSYTSSQAASLYVQPNWDVVRYHSLPGVPSCSGLQCGAEVNDDDCNQEALVYEPTGCCPFGASWTDNGSYVTVTMYQAF